MKLLFLTGSHPRHAFVARAIAKSNSLVAMVVEQRPPHVPKAPAGLSDDLRELFDLHFAKRREAEARFFGESALPDTDVLSVEKEELNTPRLQNLIQRVNPDLLISYGVHKLSDETLSYAKGERWNIHGGLSPWYRGNITHFWPSYFLEPQMTGMTVHDLTQELDQGDVVHQTVAELVPGDGLHDLACRAVQRLAWDLPKLIQKVIDGEPIKKASHKTTGRLWTAKDWRPEHLRLIYETYGDRVVDAYLGGELQSREPKLHRQF